MLLGRIAATSLDSLLKNGDITFADGGLYSQRNGFPLVMYGRESWGMKKAEHQRLDAFELWYWRGLESPIVSKKIKPVSPKKIYPEHSLLKLWKLKRGLILKRLKEKGRGW